MSKSLFLEFVTEVGLKTAVQLAKANGVTLTTIQLWSLSLK